MSTANKRYEDWDEAPSFLEKKDVLAYVVAIEDVVLKQKGPVQLARILSILREKKLYRHDINLLDIAFSRIQQNPLSYRIEWEPKPKRNDQSSFNNRTHVKGSKSNKGPALATSGDTGDSDTDSSLPE
jgi:hypothetical protein